MIIYILLVVVAYLLGSIPSSVWIGRHFYGIDVREHGSKNAGATNTLRVLGKKAGISVFVIDFLKGLAAVSLAHLAGFEPGSDSIFNFKILLVVAAVAGHILPIFAQFKGGKGVATLAGATMGVYAPAILLCLVTFFVILAITHYVSVSSMSAGVLFPIYTIFIFNERALSLIIFGCVVAVLLIFTHRKNIKRLMSGTESKIYLNKKSKTL